MDKSGTCFFFVIIQSGFLEKTRSHIPQGLGEFCISRHIIYHMKSLLLIINNRYVNDTYHKHCWRLLRRRKARYHSSLSCLASPAIPILEGNPKMREELKRGKKKKNNAYPRSLSELFQLAQGQNGFGLMLVMVIVKCQTSQLFQRALHRFNLKINQSINNRTNATQRKNNNNIKGLFCNVFLLSLSLYRFNLKIRVSQQWHMPTPIHTKREQGQIPIPDHTTSFFNRFLCLRHTNTTPNLSHYYYYSIFKYKFP